MHIENIVILIYTFISLNKCVCAKELNDNDVENVTSNAVFHGNKNEVKPQDGHHDEIDRNTNSSIGETINNVEELINIEKITTSGLIKETSELTLTTEKFRENVEANNASGEGKVTSSMHLSTSPPPDDDTTDQSNPTASQEFTEMPDINFSTQNTTNDNISTNFTKLTSFTVANDIGDLNLGHPPSTEPPQIGSTLDTELLNSATSPSLIISSTVSSNLTNAESEVPLNSTVPLLNNPKHSLVEPKDNLKSGALNDENKFEIANSTLTDVETVVRKCCHSSQYFSTKSIGCTSFNGHYVFMENVFFMRKNKFKNVTLVEESLQCVDSSPPVTNFGASNSSYVILDKGEVFDIVSNVTYDRSEYCLEMVGEPDELKFTLVYCQKPTYDYYYYDYAETITDSQHNKSLPTDVFSVRKCCLEDEYYNSQLQKCTLTDSSSSDLFISRVKDLSFKSGVDSVEIISSRLQSCPNPTTQPAIHSVSNQTYILNYNGHLSEIETGLSYNQSFYCMEQIGPSFNKLTLNIILCHKANYVLPKCCPKDHYFDNREFNCLPIVRLEYKNIKFLDNFNLDNNTYATKPLVNFFGCQNGAMPSVVVSSNFFFTNGKLCSDGVCYNEREYCIEYLGESTLPELEASAYYCRRRYFVKCCELGESLDSNGCALHSGDNSHLLKQIMRSRSIVRSFNYQECKDENALLLDDSYTKYVQWWIEEDGSYIAIQSAAEVREIKSYCIDDLKDANGKIQPSAFVCESDLENMIPIEKSQLIFKRPGSLGKCCPKVLDEDNIYAYSSAHDACQVTTSNISMNLIDYFDETNLTEEHFHDFPKCSSESVGYHTYPLARESGDYATLTPEGNLKIVSMDGLCVTKQKVVTDSDYCFEFILADEKLQASAVVCAQPTVEEIYDEKFGLMTALLVISCMCLFASLISLFTTRVRRGIVSVRKVNTLAGRILVSFVGSHLIGFLALSLSQHQNALNTAKTTGCYVLAGLIQFFNLATFCWNTSICLESLLLTINIKISDWMRYFLHSLWAWGFPGTITLLTFLMDANREKLPCGSITPNIGVHHCFLFGTAAKLLYFYLPILITLTANILFLVGAKTLRTARLKRLEKGKPKRGASKTSGPNKNGKPAASHGMRIHQSQNTKAESLRLVLWTGGTWFLELAGFVMSRYILPPQQEAWYYYLWYIPTSLNALRGVGIFAIIVLTPEVRSRGNDALVTIKRNLASKLHKVLPYTDDPAKSDTRKYSSTNNKSRSMSLSTMITSIRSSSTNDSIKPRLPSILNKLAAEKHSNRPVATRPVSQNERKEVHNDKSQSEEYEMKGETQRRIGLPSSTLPNLQEEDHTAIVHE